MDVDAIKHGTGDAFLIFGNDSRSTRAGLLVRLIVTARAGVYIIEHISPIP